MKQVAVNVQQKNETYVLYQCGTQPPPASQFSTPVKFFEIPLAGVSVPDTTSAAFLVREREHHLMRDTQAQLGVQDMMTIL